MSCNCTGHRKAENAKLQASLEAITAAWQKLAPQLWAAEPDPTFDVALQAMHAAVRGEVERHQSEVAELRAALGEAVKALEWPPAARERIRTRLRPLLQGAEERKA